VVAQEATAQLPLASLKSRKKKTERKTKGACCTTYQQGNGTRLSQDEHSAEKRTPLPLWCCEDRDLAAILGSGRVEPQEDAAAAQPGFITCQAPKRAIDITSSY